MPGTSRGVDATGGLGPADRTGHNPMQAVLHRFSASGHPTLTSSGNHPVVTPERCPIPVPGAIANKGAGRFAHDPGRPGGRRRRYHASGSRPIRSRPAGSAASSWPTLTCQSFAWGMMTRVKAWIDREGTVRPFPEQSDRVVEHNPAETTARDQSSKLSDSQHQLLVDLVAPEQGVSFGGLRRHSIPGPGRCSWSVVRWAHELGEPPADA